MQTVKQHGRQHGHHKTDLARHGNGGELLVPQLDGRQPDTPKAAQAMPSVLTGRVGSSTSGR